MLKPHFLALDAPQPNIPVFTCLNNIFHAFYELSSQIQCYPSLFRTKVSNLNNKRLANIQIFQAKPGGRGSRVLENRLH